MSAGAFVWYDLATTDPSAAAAFYAAVVGWRPEPVADTPYTVFKTGSAFRAGLMRLPPHLEAQGVPPHWTGYIDVPDVDDAVARAEAAGGQLRYGPEEIEAVGRFAVMADPEGAVFYLFTPRSRAEPAPPMTPGAVGWHELLAGAGEAALAFYAGLFGWERSQAIPMGPGASYQLFSYGGLDRGGVMAAPPGVHPHWLFYFVVDGIEAAAERVTTAGGTVVVGPVEVPGGAMILNCRDPQGARFALVSGPAAG